MNSPVGRSYPKRGQRTVSSYSGRRQRRSAGAPSRNPVVEQSEAPAQKWTKVYRNPTSPLDEPYFGSGPTATFKVLVWVRVGDLTEEEKLKYDEAEKKKGDERLAWKNAMGERNESEVDTADKKEKETKDSIIESNNYTNEAIGEVAEATFSGGEGNPPLQKEEEAYKTLTVEAETTDEQTTMNDRIIEENERTDIPIPEVTSQYVQAKQSEPTNISTEEPIETVTSASEESKEVETSNTKQNDRVGIQQNDQNSQENNDDVHEPLQKKQRLID